MRGDRRTLCQPRMVSIILANVYLGAFMGKENSRHRHKWHGGAIDGARGGCLETGYDLSVKFRRGQKTEQGTKHDYM